MGMERIRTEIVKKRPQISSAQKRIANVKRPQTVQKVVTAQRSQIASEVLTKAQPEKMSAKSSADENEKATDMKAVQHEMRLAPHRTRVLSTTEAPQASHEAVIIALAAVVAAVVAEAARGIRNLHAARGMLSLRIGGVVGNISGTCSSAREQRATTK